MAKRSYAAAAAKLAASTGKAAWVAGTSLLVLLVPLIIEMDREQQLVEMESQQMDVLGGSNSASSSSSSSS
jgi:import receptor subunit TOM22